MAIKHTVNKEKIMVFLPLFLCVLFECIQGFITGDDKSKIVSNLYCVFFIFYFVLYRKKFDFSILPKDLLTSSLVLSLLVMSLFIGLYNDANFKQNITALFRSLVIGWVVYNYACSFNLNKIVSKNIIVVIWSVISICIFISWIFNFGINTYVEFKLGHKFYFQSVNELTFVYLAMWVWIFYLGDFILKIVCSLCTFMCFAVIGSKAFLPIVIIMFGCFIFEKIYYKYGWFKTLSACVFVSGIVIYMVFVKNGGRVVISAISYVLTNYSTGGDKLVHKLSYLSPVSALMSERDRLWGYSIDLLLKHYSIIDFLFGKTFSAYGVLYGKYKGEEFSFAENDIIDIFMSYGVLGAISLGLIIKNILFDTPAKFWAKNIRLHIIVLFVISGFMTGHVMMFSFPVVVFSYLIGMASSKSK